MKYLVLAAWITMTLFTAGYIEAENPEKASIEDVASTSFISFFIWPVVWGAYMHNEEIL